MHGDMVVVVHLEEVLLYLKQVDSLFAMQDIVVMVMESHNQSK
jgi:hypothetical protein